MLLDIFFPNRCLHCRRIISDKEFVCEACEIRVSFTRFAFDGNNLLAQTCRVFFPVENAFALMYFVEDTVSQKVIHQLKYSYRESVGDILSRYAIARIPDFPKDIDIVTIVPLHRKKENERGYNQLRKFAQRLCAHYDVPLREDILLRKYHTKAQALKNKSERKNTEHLFAVQKEMNNTHFLLIDDVFTTGNTIASIAWKLLKSGENNRVSILVMAMNVGYNFTP